MIRLTVEQGMLLLDLIEKSGDVSVRDTVGKLISDQVAAPSHESDLIDTIARVINQRGRARNVMTDERLEVLRSAIFSPRDLMRFNATVDAVCCASCGNSVRNESMVGIIDGNAYCSLCFTPTNITCTGCRGSIYIFDSLNKMMKNLRTKCDACAEKKSAKAEAQRAESGGLGRTLTTAAAPRRLASEMLRDLDTINRTARPPASGASTGVGNRTIFTSNDSNFSFRTMDVPFTIPQPVEPASPTFGAIDIETPATFGVSAEDERLMDSYLDDDGDDE